MADQEPRLLECPSCRKPLVLLSIESYPRLVESPAGELDELPGDIQVDARNAALAHAQTDAKFAVVDRNGSYLCGWCDSIQRV
jgi:hypothetical protein